VLYLFGVSPVVCKSFLRGSQEGLAELSGGTLYVQYATSLRMSDLGYRNRNQAGLAVSVNSLDEYVRDLTRAIMTPHPPYEALGVKVDGEYEQLTANILQIENEYYSPIRPKPGKRHMERPTIALRQHGVEYVEVRTLDLNPADPVGINQNQLRFLETLLIFCLLEDSPPISPSEQREIDERDLSVAREGRRPALELPRAGRHVALRQWGLELLERMRGVAELLDEKGMDYVASIDAQREALEQPEATLSARLLHDLKATRSSFFEYMLGVARRHHDYFRALTLSAEQEAEFKSLTARSLDDQRSLEADASVPFDEYLERYFRQA
jgi:glutamate--cysteine ligase